MATYILLSSLAPDSLKDPGEFPKLAQAVSIKIKAECPNVRWKDSYALMGRYDVVDIIEADDPADVAKAAMIIRTYGHATTETMQGIPWKELVSRMSATEKR